MIIDGIDPSLTRTGLLNEPLDIFCDESGHTGPRLLDAQQRLFSYAAVALNDAEAYTIIANARQAHPQQMPELKAAKLCRTPVGRALILEVLNAIRGRYAVVVYDKLLALCGKVFEYIYEPVYKNAPELLYEKNLHRFVAMYCYLFFSVDDDDPSAVNEAERAVREFEWFMRTLDPARAPKLFGPGTLPHGSSTDPFELILHFAQGYRHLILPDNASIATETPDGGKWTLDLAISALFSLCNHWGRTGRPLRITCDESKPLQAMVHILDGSAHDPIIRRARDIVGSKGSLGWRMAAPATFADSRDHPALQVADIVAGAATAVIAGRGDPDLVPIAEALFPHFNRDMILPDFELIDFQKNREAAVNWLILHDLADRARRNADPYEGLAERYHAAEVMWARGDFEAMVKAQLGEDA